MSLRRQDALPVARFFIICVAVLFASLVGVATADELQPDHPDRNVQPGVPQGTLTSHVFEDSKIFPGTRRDYSVYIPAQYSDQNPACLMVFQDGAGYANVKGAFRVPVVFDNLIHQKAMPVTIAVFVNPGSVPPTKPGANPRSNRSFEYDSLGDRYARFLKEEFLPVALKAATEAIALGR